MGSSGIGLERAAGLLREAERVRWLAALYGPDHPRIGPARERLAGAAAALGTGRVVLEVRPSGMRWREERLPDRGGALRRLAGVLFGHGVVALVLDPPVDAEGLARFALELARLGAERGAQLERVLAAADPVRGLALVPLDVSRFVFGRGTGSGGSALWDLVVADLTGGALGGEGEGGAGPREMAALAAGAGDPYGFLELLVDRVVRHLDEAERGGRLLDGLELLRAVRELVEALTGRDRAHLARLLLRRSHPPESLAAGLAQLLPAELFLDAVEALLAEGVAPPPAVQRLVYQLAAPAEEARDPWRRRGERLPPATVERARSMLGAMPAAGDGTSSETPPPPPPAVEREEVAVAGAAAGTGLAAALEPAEVQAELDRVLLDTALESPSPSLLDALAGRYLELLQAGRFEAASQLVAILVVREAPGPLERVAGPEGVAALLDAFTAAGTEGRRRVLEVVRTLGEPLVPALLERLGEEENLSARRRLMEMVVAIGPPAVPHLEALLGDRRWYVVRNALLLLRLLRDPGVGDRAAALLGHADPRVVAEATRSLLASRDSRWLEGLDRLLGWEEPRAFREALAIAGRLRHPVVAARLLAQLARRRGRRLREPETAALIETLGAFPGPEVVTALEELVELRQWRVPFRLTPVREALARAAAKLPDPHGRRLLERLAALPDPAAEVAARLLRRREGER